MRPQNPNGATTVAPKVGRASPRAKGSCAQHMPTASHPASIRRIFRQTEFICDRVSRVRVPWQTLFAAPQDTNIASYFIKGHTAVRRRLAAIPMDEIAISSVTEGELRYGVARLPDHARLKTIVEAFLIRVNVQPWTRRRRDAVARSAPGWKRAGLGWPI